MKMSNRYAGQEAALALPWNREANLARRRKRNAALAWLFEALAACGAFEWVALAYLGLTGALIAVFHRHLAHASLFFALQFGVAVLLLVLSWSAVRWPSKALVAVRHWYPQAFFLFCFEELHYLVHLIFPGWFDRWLIAFDYRLAGVHPTVWFEQFANPALNDFMQMAYISYFFYLTILGGLLYANRERRALWAVMTSSVVAYTIGYLIALLLPVESPYHALAALQRAELTGGFFTALIDFFESFGRVHGAAFPSAHVSGSLVALLGAWRYRPWLFWVFLPFFLCLMVATVYGRYHYVADVLGGLVVGAIGFVVGHRLMRCEGAVPPVEVRREA